MEEMFREDQLQKTKEIAELSKEIQALKVTLIGTSGGGGGGGGGRHASDTKGREGNKGSITFFY